MQKQRTSSQGGGSSPHGMPHLDMIRGVAALAVAVGHVRALFFVSFGQIQGATGLHKVLYGATSLGHQAVIVFFVLSGFLITRSVLRGWNAGQWSWPLYLINRGARLYVALIPALLLTAACDWAGRHTAQGAWLYQIADPLFGPQPFLADFTWRAFAGSAAFLQTIATPCFGSDQPLWSLANEFWYYLFFPALLYAATPRVAIGKRIAYAGLLAIGLWFVRQSIAVYFLVWLMGSSIAWVTLARMPSSRKAAIVLAGLAAACIAGPWIAGRGALADFGLGAIMSLVVWAAWSREGFPVGGAYRRLAALLAGFSYTLYVSHFPLLVLARAIILPGARWQPTAAALAAGAAILSGALLCAFALSRVTEAKTGAARAFLVSLIRPGIRKKPAEPAAGSELAASRSATPE